MSKVLFDCCVIARNEIKTLPKLRASLEPFFAAGGQANLLDTGSTDGTAEFARQLGFNVKEVGTKFLIPVENPDLINQKFIVKGEAPIVKEGDTYFNFAAARNECAEMARENVCFWYDADEVSVAMNIDAINKSIEDGFTQWEYFFCFAYDSFGNEAVKFIQCKAYDRRVMRWSGRIHELVVCIDNAVGGKRLFLDEQTYKLAHHQNQESGRHSYSIGLAVDSFEFPDNDRHKHYCARELMWNFRPKSALKMFKEHTEMMGWASERAESFLFMGDLEGQLGNPQQQIKNYNEAFYIDSGRNKALINIALFYRHNKNYQAAVCYAKAALEITYSGFYADNLAYYREIPHEILYQCYGYMGKIEDAQKHLLKALEYQELNPTYLRDTKFYFEYPDNGIEGWMIFPELQFLYEQGKKHNSAEKVMVEIGSWKGKSTHALLSGCKTGTVYAVDTWEGSEDVRDSTNWMAKVEDVYEVFKNNTKQFPNLKMIRKTSIEAAKDFEDNSIDFCFIDAGHTYEDVISDIEAWLPKVKSTGIICGHDYVQSWMGVIDAVNEKFGRADELCSSIWWVDLSNRVRGFNPTKNIVEVSKWGEKDLIPLGEKKTSLIPHDVFTVWLGDDMPELIKMCIGTQKFMCKKYGYEHHVITLEDAIFIAEDDKYEYLRQALNSPHPDGVKYCKASDWLRMHYLYEAGGIYLDADVEIMIDKNFDAMLNDQMFVGLETANWESGKVVLGTAIVGSIPAHPMIKEWKETVERDFRGDDDKNYQSSMNLLNLIGVKYQDKMKLYDPEYFYPLNSVTKEYVVSSKTICIHHFLKTWTPKTMLAQFKYNIENNFNFTFVKRGDGELACMNGEPGGNCDGHPYSKELGERLSEAYEYFKCRPNTSIVEFDDQVNYNTLLHRTDSNLKEVSEFYKAIAVSKREKFFIGPDKLKPVAALLGAKHIIIPELNWWNSYKEIQENVPMGPGVIYLFCAGMPAKVLIHDIMKWEMTSGPATYLDCGSAFDPSVGTTRTFQISKEQFWDLYKNEDLAFDQAKEIYYQQKIQTDNFNLPQETHPERLWAANQLKEWSGVVWDVGCGSNKTVPWAIGFDIRTDVADWCGDIQNIKSPGLVDVIISKHSLEHLLNPVKSIRNWTESLKPGGKMLIILPDHEFIDTMDDIYSRGQHLHAYTRESFAEFISLFPELYISKQETVLEAWSFGTVIYKLPKVSVVLPTLGRPEGLENCLMSIEVQDYPKHLIEVIVIDGEEKTVPQKVAEGVEQSTGQYICYAANDTEMHPDTISTAIKESLSLGKGLVSFNSGPLLMDRGNINEHFIISKDLVQKIGGYVFDLSFWHCGCDNYLWQQCEDLGEAYHSKNAKMIHNHFSKGGEIDDVYQKGWSKNEQDRRILVEKLIKLKSDASS